MSFKPMSDAEFRSILAQGLGEASMCWSPSPSHQVFDSDRAVNILDRLVEGLREKKAAVHRCSKCGKTHAPRCDRCGATTDLRSYHGPCGKCAFGKTASMVKYTKKRLGQLKGQPDPFPLYDDPAYRAEPVKAASVTALTPPQKKGTRMRRKHDNNLATEQEADPITEDPYRFPRLSQMEKEAMMRGFADELEKIAVISGFIKDLGTKIVGKVGRGGTWTQALRTAPARTYEAAKESILHPAQTLRAGWKETWSPTNPQTGLPDTGLANRGFFLGGTAMGAATALPKKDPMGRDESRLTRGLRFAAGTATGMMGMKRGVIPSLALGVAGDVAGGFAGRGIDKLRGRKMRPKKDAPGPLMPNRVAGPVAAIPEGTP